MGRRVLPAPLGNTLRRCAAEGDTVKTEAFKKEFRAARAAWEEHARRRRVEKTDPGLAPWLRDRTRGPRCVSWQQPESTVLPSSKTLAREALGHLAWVYYSQKRG